MTRNVPSTTIFILISINAVSEFVFCLFIMEKLNDLLKRQDFLPTSSQVALSEEPNLEATLANDDIEKLISELTDTRQLNNIVNITDKPQNDHNQGLQLQDPPNLDEILTVDESLITPTSHNVSVINSACQHVLKEIEHQLLALLKKNRKEQEIVQEFLSSNGKSPHFEVPKKSSIKSIGMPYFKDMQGYQQPPNDDVLRKQRENKLLPVDFIEGFPTWNNADAKTLIKAVSSYDISQPGSIDWMKISVTDMEGKYSPSECKSKWYMNLNPSINRSKWGLKELERLRAFSAQYNYQDWDKIASELGTSRTGLQCCIQYMTHTFPTQGKWTKEEDETLIKLIEKYRIKDYIPWAKVVWHFQNRSLKQCQERYTYHLGDIKKGTFTSEEDFLIVYLAPKLKNFGEVAKFLPKRVATQVRARYEYLVELSMPNFTKEEDELLSKLMALYPRDWGKISSHFTNRSRVQCRRRWGYLQRKITLSGDLHSESETEEVSLSPLDVLINSKNSNVDTENYYKLNRNVHLPVKSSQSDKKQSEAYNKLLDYHKNSHKFLFGPKPRISVNPEDQNKLVTKMKLIMKTLSVGQMEPLSGFNIESLSQNCEFDKEDIDVLTGLKCSDDAGEFEVSKTIIPPNYMTLVGLRSLTLNWKKMKNLCQHHTETSSFNPNIDPNDRLLCTDAKKLFKSRMKSLFAFPLIMSSISPSNQKLVYKPKARKAVKPLSKLKRKEHARLMNAAYKEKLKALNQRQESDPTEVCSGTNSKKNKEKAKSSKTPPKSEMKGCNENKSSRKRVRSCNTQNTEVVTPLKKRTLRSSVLLDSS